MKNKENTNQIKGNTLPGKKKFRIPYQNIILGVAAFAYFFVLQTNQVLATDMWTKAESIMKDVYGKILGISTIAAIVTASVALLLMNNQEGYFDCSSFTYWVYSQLGVYLQHGGSNTAAAQARYITENNLAVSYDSLAPGDLIFYSFEVNNRYLNISHVAIYAGNGYVVDASFSKKKVVYRPICSIRSIVLCGRPYAE